MKTLCLCGAGNSEGVRLAQRINEKRRRWQRIVLLDDDPEKHGKSILGVEIVGPFSALADLGPGECEVANLVARTTAGRRAARRKIEEYGHPFADLISEDVDTLGVELPQDLTVYPNATIGPGVTIEEGTVVFMGAAVGHESRVGPGCVLASNSVLNARVELGEGVYVGTNATVLPEIKIGAWATVGAGSAVVEDVPEGATVMGVPAGILVQDPRAHEHGADRGSGPQRPSADARPQRDPPGLKRTEVIIAEVWCEVLDVARVSPTHNFFDIGGSSLHALRVREALERSGLSITVLDVFRFPTVRSLARHLAGVPTDPQPGGPEGPSADRDDGRTDWTGERSSASSGDGDGLTPVITAVYERVLGVSHVGPEESFFELGGDTLLADRACAELLRLTGLRLCFMHVVRYPTAEGLADFLDDGPPHPASVCPARPTMSRLLHRQRASAHRGDQRRTSRS